MEDEMAMDHRLSDGLAKLTGIFIEEALHQMPPCADASSYDNCAKPTMERG
jgi:hypothetical protein